LETNGTTSSNVEELLAQATPEAAGQLQLIAEHTTDKETRKAARRALYLLSQKKIVPPPAPTHTPGAESLTARAAQRQAVLRNGLRAYASAMDGAGNRLLFLIWPDPDGGSPTFLQALVSDEEGVKDIDTRRIPRNELTERLAGFDAQLDAGIALAEIDGDYGRFLLLEATERTQQVHRRTPQGFRDLLAIIGEPNGTYPEPPVWQQVTPESLRNDPDLNHDPEALFSTEWFQPWFLDVQTIGPHMQPPTESTQATIESATEIVDRVMDAEMAARYRRRLAESADILLRRGKVETARQALYHALTLQNPETIAESAFAVALVQRTMQVALEMYRSKQV